MTVVVRTESIPASALHRLRALDSGRGKPPGQVDLETARDDKVADQPADILCAHCGHPITRESARIVLQGSHDHERENPAGQMFHFGCFVVAPGCSVSGSPTNEHSWFPGYSWCFAACSQCGTHLGWQFESQDHNFYGLILNRLSVMDPS